MISLRINDISFPLPAGFSIPYDLVTNVLNLNAIEPSFTLPIPLPATDEVKAFFGHPHELQSTADLSTVYDAAAILIDDNVHWQGVVELAKAGLYTYTLHFRMASGHITTVLKGKKLREVFKDDLVSLPAQTFNVYTIEWVPDPKDLYSVYIDGALYSRPSTQNDPAAVLPLLATDLATHASIATAEFEDNNVSYSIIITTEAGISLVVTAETFKAANSNQGSWDPEIEVPFDEYLDMTVTILQRMEILPDLNSGDYVLPVMHLPNLYNGLAPDYSGFVNVQEGGRFFYDKPSDPLQLTSTIIPCIRRLALASRLKEKFNIRFNRTALYDDISWRFLHEFVPRPIDTEMYAANQTGNFTIDISFADLLPDITVGEWIQSWKVLTCGVTTFLPNGREMVITPLSKILAAQPAMDWSQYLVSMHPVEQLEYTGLKVSFGTDSADAEITDHAKARETFRFKGSVILEADLAALNGTTLVDDVYYVTSRNAYYIRTTGGWDFHSHNLDGYTADEGGLEFTIPYQPLPDTLATVNGQTMLMPVSQLVGYSIPLGLDKKDWHPRVSVYRASQQSQQGAYYYMSSIGTYKSNGAPITHIGGSATDAAPSLGLANHPLGINHAYADFLQLLKNYKPVKATFHLPEAILSSFNHTDKVTVNGANFLIEKITSTLTDAGLGLVEVEMVKVP